SHHSTSLIFFYNDPPTTKIYTLSLHDALPILLGAVVATFENSTVYLTWWDIDTNNIMFESSSNRGQTWSPQVQVNDRIGSAAPVGAWQIPIPAMNVDRNSGAIYLAWPDHRNGNQDIYIANSTDGG